MYDKEEKLDAFLKYELNRNKPVPSFNHGAIQANIIFLLKLNFDKKYRFVLELDLELSGWKSTPDISFFPWKKMDTKNDIVRVSESPLCTIEILSPTQSLNELLFKAQSYFEQGVKSCWIVLPVVGNIYVFTSPDEYEIFKLGETLHDKIMDIKIEIDKVFE